MICCKRISKLVRESTSLKSSDCRKFATSVKVFGPYFQRHCFHDSCSFMALLLRIMHKEQEVR